MAVRKRRLFLTTLGAESNGAIYVLTLTMLPSFSLASCLLPAESSYSQVSVTRVVDRGVSPSGRSSRSVTRRQIRRQNALQRKRTTWSACIIPKRYVTPHAQSQSLRAQY